MTSPGLTLCGWAPASAQIAYSGPTETVRDTLTGGYGDEEKNTSLTTETIDRSGDEVPDHSATLTINDVELSKLQNATLSFENISRLQPGPSQKPVDAVAGNVSTSLEMASIYEDSTQYEHALGAAGSSSIQADVTEVPASLTFDVAGRRSRATTSTVSRRIRTTGRTSSPRRGPPGVHQLAQPRRHRE